jgi:hypothetical protein
VTADPQHWARLPRLEPSQGTVIRRPPAAESGYWVGAPGAYFDEREGSFYLAYRVRRPRGVKPDRGAEVHLARSRDGTAFETIWTGTKEQLNSASIERCAVRRRDDGSWMLYVSYVDPADGRWRIDAVGAGAPDRFELQQAQPVLTAGQLGVEGVKDPFVFRVAGMYHMIVSFATADEDASADELHGTQDAYNTGLVRSRTGLAVSSDGIHWDWQGPILEPSQSGWDRYCARIGCLWRQDGLWIALYDGSANASENYEERVGVAFSCDLRHFSRVTADAPWMQPPHGQAALRYFDVLKFPDRTFFYYEMAQADGSHDLRVLSCEW